VIESFKPGCLGGNGHSRFHINSTVTPEKFGAGSHANPRSPSDQQAQNQQSTGEIQSSDRWPALMDARPTNKLKRPYPRIYVNLKLQNPNVFRAAGRLLNITAMLT
jgi:hypothetical protein